MKLLLDTHAFLWFAAGDRRLSLPARRAMEAPDAELHFSAASVWEMAIKASLGRLTLSDPIDTYVAKKIQMGYRMVPVTWKEAAAVQQLPSQGSFRSHHHRAGTCGAVVDCHPRPRVP